MYNRFKKLIYVVLSIAVFSILPVIFLISAANPVLEDTVVSILNLVDNQIIDSDYIIEFETPNSDESESETTENVELKFISLAENTTLYKQVYAQRDVSNNDLWRYSLQIEDFSDGSYQLNTYAHYANGSNVPGDSRLFSVSTGPAPTESVPVEENNQNSGDSSLENDDSSTDNQDATNNQDNTNSTVEIIFITPKESAFVSDRVLVQTQVNQQVEDLYLRIDGILFIADNFEGNSWQAYFDSTDYDNGELQIIAVASNLGESYNSDILTVIVNNTEQGLEIIDEEVQDDTEQDSSDKENNNSEEDDSSLNNEDSNLSDIEEEEYNNKDKEEELEVENDECAEYRNNKISCSDYLLDDASIPESCLEFVISAEECNVFNNDCLELGFGEKYYLCEQYLNEPRLSRWCDLDDFKDLPVCDYYIDDNNIDNQEIAASKLDQLCLEQSIISEDECVNYLEYLKLPSLCRKHKVLAYKECKQFLHDNYFDLACQQLGISDKQACGDYLISFNSPKYVCASGDCQEQIIDNYIDELAALSVVNKQVRSFIPNVVNKNFQVELNDENPLAKAFIERIPVLYNGQNFKVIPTEDKIVIGGATLITALPAALVYDSDGDGLPDDIEERLGTNILNPDSDGDGYLDGEEVANGYDPLSTSNVLDKKLAPVEEALISGREFEQPLFSGLTSKDLTVTDIGSWEDLQKTTIGADNIALTGTGPAFSVATLYIYSDLPLIATVQVDASGRWQYEIKDSLLDGEHKIYVAINDETGKIVKKSTVRNFFVKEARAISVAEYVDLKPKQSPKLWEKYYLYGAVIIFLLAIVLFFILYRSSTRSSIKL